MPNTYLTSDEHYGHKRIPELADRPFSSMEEQTATLVDNHNAVVRSDDDLTFHLGDFFFGPKDDGRMAEILASLRGRHVLIAGNHDRCSATQTNGWAHQRTYLDAGFETVVDVATLTLPEVSIAVDGRRRTVQARKVMLSHFPYAADHTTDDDGQAQVRYAQHRLRDEGKWLLHGHVHQAYRIRDRGVNVGVDAPGPDGTAASGWNYKPVPVHDVARLIAEVEAGLVPEDPYRDSGAD